MADDQKAGESAKHAGSPSPMAQCRACREPIQPGAKLCPHCGSPQARRRWWHITSVVLKWVGATSAILSLLALSIQLGEIFQDGRKTSISVGQLVQAADRLVENNDLSGSMEMLDEALLLDPGDPDTRRLQVKVAIQQIQRCALDSGECKEIEPLIPKLRRGIGLEDPRSAADVLAHLGWAYWRTDRPYSTAGKFFEDALSLDPKNVFANTYRGAICAENDSEDESLSRACGEQREQRVATAAGHFRLAFGENREQDFVARIAFEYLLRNRIQGPEDDIEALALAKYLMDKGFDSVYKHGWELVDSLRETMDHGLAEASLLQRLSAAELLKLVETIARDPEDKRYTDDIMVARLIGLTGDTQESIERLRRLRLRVQAEIASERKSINYHSLDYIDETIIRTLGLKTVKIGDMGIGAELDEKRNPGSPDVILVKQVMVNGPADRAGLKQGDRIVAVGDVRASSLDFIRNFIQTFAPGTKIMLTILRQNSERKIAVSLGPGTLGPDGAPEILSNLGGFTELHSLYKIVNRYFYECVDIEIGGGRLQVAELNREFRSALNLDNDIEGIIILDAEGFLSDAECLTHGKVILEVNSRQIRTPGDLKKAILAAVDDGVGSLFIVMSNAKGISNCTISDH